MQTNLKKRIYTSIALIFLLFSMMFNNFILTYFLIIMGIVSFLEFSKIISIIYKKNISSQLLFNLLFILYVFTFCSLFAVFSFFLYLKILIFIILLTCVASDVGGFIFGKIFKGPKLTNISPNKTISGSIGSFLFSIIIFSVLFFYIIKNLEFTYIFIGFVTSLGCQLGDLFFSFLKRKSFLKDTGKFLPGHGGILDRVDGILLGAPIGFLATLLMF